MSSNDGIKKTLIVAFTLCIVCSLVVSAAAVVLKPAQEVNKTLDRKRSILATAGMLQEGVPVEEQFSQVEPRIVDLRSGKFTDEVDLASFDQRKSAKNPATSQVLDGEQDIAKIKRRSDYAEIYLVNDSDGNLQKIILPVHGYGLWSTLYGFMALEADLNTVVGLGFAEHAETPGLGGEVDNPNWKAKWPGKAVYKDGKVALHLIKGVVDPAAANAAWEVDGLSGASLTSRGVSNLIQFWLGEQGFQPFIENLKAGEA
ncbi:MAG: Na(+)-translocating NADH-quinone reductase subunit C [Parahaliea sp.]